MNQYQIIGIYQQQQHDGRNILTSWFCSRNIQTSQSLNISKKYQKSVNISVLGFHEHISVMVLGTYQHCCVIKIFIHIMVIEGDNDT